MVINFLHFQSSLLHCFHWLFCFVYYLFHFGLLMLCSFMIWFSQGFGFWLGKDCWPWLVVCEVVLSRFVCCLSRFIQTVFSVSFWFVTCHSGCDFALLTFFCCFWSLFLSFAVVVVLCVGFSFEKKEKEKYLHVNHVCLHLIFSWLCVDIG